MEPMNINQTSKMFKLTREGYEDPYDQGMIVCVAGG